MTKGRSPNYPSLPLRDAIERIKQVYQAEHTYKADKEVVAQALGYSGVNGKSLMLIGTLKRYGLLEAEGEGLKVSDDAVAILELSQNDPERCMALERAAFASALFAELRDTYGDNLAISDTNLKHFLIKKKFLPKAADDVIRIYRDNLEFVSQQNEVYNERYNTPMKPTPSQNINVIPNDMAIAQAARKFLDKPTFPSPYDHFQNPEIEESAQELKFRLSADSDVRLIFRGEVTQKAITKLIGLLNLSMDTFPESETVPPQIIESRQPNMLEEADTEIENVSEADTEEE